MDEDQWDSVVAVNLTSQERSVRGRSAGLELVADRFARSVRATLGSLVGKLPAVGVASLELRKLYVVLSDTFASDHEMLRIIDESGEDYLYPESYFVRVELPRAVERTLRKIA